MYCRNCGALLSEAGSFCPQCGCGTGNQAASRTAYAAANANPNPRYWRKPFLALVDLAVGFLAYLIICALWAAIVESHDPQGAQELSRLVVDLVISAGISTALITAALMGYLRARLVISVLLCFTSCLYFGAFCYFRLNGMWTSIIEATNPVLLEAFRQWAFAAGAVILVATGAAAILHVVLRRAAALRAACFELQPLSPFDENSRLAQ